jgi:uncharacterized membrane protein
VCQGVVISLVKFTANGKKKKVVLSGIGSHSDLIKDNVKKLKRSGWKENSSGESIISIESDFSGWNKYMVESGKPSESELAILTREYKKCAGNAKALIAHVKRCGKIDNALIALLTASAWAECEKVTASAWAECGKVMASAWAEYKKVTAPAWAEYEKVTAPAWAEYKKVRASAQAECEKVRDSAWAECEKVRASAQAEYGKVMASAWIKLFSKKENRVERLR